MAVDEQTARLQDAAKHFASGAYPVCLRVLSTCPADDPKVAHNTALVQFMIKSGNVREMADTAALLPRSVGPAYHMALEYEGHDLACVNTAIIRWHVGDVEGARELLVMLAHNASSLCTKAQVRTAALLHVTRHAASNSAENDKLVHGLLADKNAYQSDAGLSKLVQVALASDSATATRSWFLSTPKPDVIDKIMYYNNVGIDAFTQGKHGVAGVLFSKCMALTTAGTATLCPFVVSAVAFNVALCAIARGDGSAAAIALSVAQHTMSGSPQYWIRLAQATVLRTIKKMRQLSQSSASGSEKAQSTDLAAHGRLPSTAAALAAFSQRRPTVSSDPEVRQLLATVRHAAGNVVLLLSRGDSLVVTAQRNTTSALQFAALTSALIYESWAELQLGNHAAVVKHSSDFFAIYKTPANSAAAVHRAAVASMMTYAVEALCATNRAAQALKLMASVELGDVIADTAATGQAEALFITLCSAHIMNGAWSKAVAIAQHVVAKFHSRYAQLLLVYIELAQGNRDKALDILERTPILAPDF